LAGNYAGGFAKQLLAEITLVVRPCTLHLDSVNL
jgi:hypothetical protein